MMARGTGEALAPKELLWFGSPQFPLAEGEQGCVGLCRAQMGSQP